LTSPPGLVIIPAFFWHLLLLILSPLSVTVWCLMGDDHDRQVLTLRQQILTLYGGGSFRGTPAFG
jgi:hypothetical protein